MLFSFVNLSLIFLQNTCITVQCTYATLLLQGLLKLKFHKTGYLFWNLVAAVRLNVGSITSYRFILSCWRWLKFHGLWGTGTSFLNFSKVPTSELWLGVPPMDQLSEKCLKSWKLLKSASDALAVTVLFHVVRSVLACFFLESGITDVKEDRIFRDGCKSLLCVTFWILYTGVKTSNRQRT